MLNFVSVSVPVLIFQYIFYVLTMKNSVEFTDFLGSALLSAALVGLIQFVSIKFVRQNSDD